MHANPSSALHVPVLLNEMLDALAPEDGKRYVDATFGAGGYSRAILEKADCAVVAIDRDPAVLPLARETERDFPGRFSFVPGEFGEMDELLKGREADGVVLDVGVSSMQIDAPERGFSFRENGPLDMRMGQEGLSAKDVVNGMDESVLADVIYAYGGERRSRAVAAKIVRKRQEAPIETTAQLAAIVHSCFPRAPRGGIDNATRTFQALRIYVNDELRQLESALAAAERILRPGGRLVAVTFHSLEDRIVKRFMQQTSSASPSSPQPTSSSSNGWTVLTKKPAVPSEREARENPRSRSAKLRAAAKK
jgi:16S rRNA (cytosine1402-N4)-methyltransferase